MIQEQLEQNEVECQEEPDQDRETKPQDQKNDVYDVQEDAHHDGGHDQRQRRQHDRVHSSRKAYYCFLFILIASLFLCVSLFFKFFSACVVW